MVMTMKRIGLLTSGGDCQGLNAALHGVAKALYEYYDKDVELYGLRDGYRGLIEGDYRLMNREDFSGILCLGGTILGTSRQPFKLMRVVDENSVDKVKAMKATYKKLKLDCLVILGGNGTHKTANLLREEGLNVVTMPIMICGARIRPLDSRARLISPPMSWIASIPLPPPTEGCLLWS